MSAVFLDDSEISQMTRRKRRDAQRVMLNALGIQYMVRADGSFLISRSHVEKMLGGSETERKGKNLEPNWEAM